MCPYICPHMCPDCTTAKPSVSHDAFSGMHFFVAFCLLMTKFLKETFSDWRKSPSGITINNGTEVIGC